MKAFDAFDDSPDSEEDESDYDSDSSDYFYPSQPANKEPNEATEDTGGVAEQPLEAENDRSEGGLALDINYEALKHIASVFFPEKHGNCIGARTVSENASGQVDILDFEDGWNCVGIFTHGEEHLKMMMERLEMKVASHEDESGHPSKRALETYLANFDSNDVVGSAFALVEHLQGQDFGRI